MINKQEAIDNIVDNFDWDKVHRTMVALKWVWYNNGEYGIPNIGQLFDCAIDLLHRAYDMSVEQKCNSSIGTGGFYARTFIDEHTKEIISLRLTFELCNWDYYEEID